MDVLAGGQDAGQRVVLGDENHSGRAGLVTVLRHGAVDLDLALRGPDQAGQRPQQGGLPGAGRAGHRDHPPRPGMQVDTDQDLVAVVVDVHVARDDLGHAGSPPNRERSE
jgi:hypothetical protein